MAASSRLVIRISGEATDLDRELARAQRNLIGLSQRLEAFAAPALIPLTLGIGGIGAAALKSAAELDSLTRGLAAVTKESGPLEAQLARLREVAKLPGLGFEEAVRGSVNLQAAGFSAQNAERALKAFGNALATVGKGRAELDGVILALTQIQGKGKFAAQEFNQLAERLPQIRIAAQAAFGTVDTEAISKLGLSAEESIGRLIREFEKIAPVTSGISNDFQNLRDKITQSLAKAGQALIPFASTAVNAFSQVVDAGGKFAEAFGKSSEAVQLLAVSMAGFAVTLPVLATAVAKLADLKVALTAVNQVLLTSTGQIGLLAGAFVSAAAVIIPKILEIERQLDEAFQKRDRNEDAKRIVQDFAPGNSPQTGPGSGSRTIQEFQDIAKESESAAAAMKQFGQRVSADLEGAAPKVTVLKEGVSNFGAAMKALGNLKPFSEIQAEATAAKQALNIVRTEVLAGRRPIQDLENATAAYHKILRDLGLEAPQVDAKLRSHRGEIDNVVRAWAAIDERAANLRKISAVWDQIKAATLIAGEAFDKVFKGTELDEFGEHLRATGEPVQLVVGAIRTLEDVFAKTEVAGINLGKALESNTFFLRNQSEAAYTAADSLKRFTDAQQNAATTAAFQQFGEENLAPLITPRPVEIVPIVNFQNSDEVVQNAIRQQQAATQAAAQSAGELLKPVEKIRGAARQVSTVITDLSRGIADVILNGKSLGDAFRNVFIDISKAILRYGIELSIKPLIGALDKLLSKLFNVKTVFGDVFGGGSTPKTAPRVDVPGPNSPNTSTGGVGGAALSGALGYVSLGLQAVDAVFTTLQFFQGRRMEQDIGRIEVTTRGQLNQLISIQQRLDEWLPFLGNLPGILEKVGASFNLQPQLAIAGGGALESFPSVVERVDSSIQNNTIVKNSSSASTSNVINIAVNTQARTGEEIAKELVRQLRLRDVRFGQV